MTNNIRPLLTVHDVCQILRIKRSTLYAWVQSGKLPCLRVGGLLRFDRDSISQWLEGLRQSRKEEYDQCRSSPRI